MTANKHQLLGRKIDELFLSVRASNVLINAGVEKIGELARLTENQLLRLPNCGRKSVEEIKDALQTMGLHLGMTVTEGDLKWDHLNPRDLVSSLSNRQKCFADLEESEKAKMFLKITNFNFTTRTKNVLSNAKISIVGDLISRSRKELLSLSGSGRTSLSEIESELQRVALKLGTRFPDWNSGMEKSKEAQNVRLLTASLRRELQAASLPSAESLEDELRSVLASVTNGRNLEIAERYFGWAGNGCETLEEVGNAFGLTRERVRQITSRIERALQSKEFDLPWLGRAVAAIHENCPATESSLSSTIQRLEIAKSPFIPIGIKVASDMFNLNLRCSTSRASGIKIYEHKSQENKVFDFFRTCRLLTSAAGCVNFEAACDEVNIRKVDRSNLEKLITGTMPLYCSWLDDEKSWLIAGGRARNRLVNLIEKVLSVSSDITLSELRRAVGRSRRLSSVPPTTILAKFIQTMDLGTIISERVYARPHQQNTIKANGAEEILISVLRANDNVLSWERFQELSVSAGLNPTTFGIYISNSPVIARIDRGIYSLVGANLEPGILEDLRSRSVQARKRIEHGWSSRGTLWCALPVNGIALGPGAAVLPQFVADLVEGEWLVQLAQRATGTTVKCKGRFLWSLRSSLLKLGAEFGDDCILEFNLSDRSLNIFVGSDETVERWEDGLEQSTPAELEESTEEGPQILADTLPNDGSDAIQ